MHPIDLLTYYRDHLQGSVQSDSRDPDFCRIALQLCKDLPQERPMDLNILILALHSVLKQANWKRKGLIRLFGPSWLNHQIAHSGLENPQDQAKLLWLARSIALTSKKYRTHLFENHGFSRKNQQALKYAILFICIAIHQGRTNSYFESLAQINLPD